MSNGRAIVDGARFSTDALFAPGAALEFVATFGAESFQHVGFGLTLNETPWALFSTGGGLGVYARTNDGTQSVDTLIPGSFIGQPHRYRIDWTPSSVIYSIDGAVVATHPLAITTNMRPIASDAQVGVPLLLDWLHLGPYAPASTFLSRIFDAGTGVDWSSASYTAQTPTGTGVSISVRSGNVAIPDASWTAFTPVADASASIGLQGRYIQYQATLTTSSPSDTPALQDVTFTGTALPTLTVADVTVNEGNSGTTTAQFTVALSVPASAPVTVAYATADGSAVAGSDYTATNGTLTFPTGTATQVINVPIVADTDVEGDETFSLILSAPTNATLGRPQAIATIVDDDVPAASIADASITEGNTGTSNLVFTVTLSQPSTKIITVDYATADGTAVAGSDYTATSGTLTFPAGTTTQTVVVPVLGDTTIEATETFTVTLSNPTNLTIGTAQATGTIVTDDLPTLSINDVSTTENASGNNVATFTVTLSAAFPQAVTVNYATANVTATAGADYTATAGTLTFPANTTSQTITVPVLDDALDENDETYSVVLSAPVNATIAKAIGTGTIVDNDPTPSLTINNVSVAEGNSGTTPAVFTVTLSAPSGRTVTVNYATANGTATAGSDYTAASGTLTFPAGSTTQTIAVPVLGDTTVEASESFVVSLSSATNASTRPEPGNRHDRERRCEGHDRHRPHRRHCHPADHGHGIRHRYGIGNGNRRRCHPSLGVSEPGIQPACRVRRRSHVWVDAVGNRYTVRRPLRAQRLLVPAARTGASPVSSGRIRAEHGVGYVLVSDPGDNRAGGSTDGDRSAVAECHGPATVPRFGLGHRPGRYRHRRRQRGRPGHSDRRW